MYLTAIAWIYVVLLMSIAEATSSTGSLLGAVMTFFLYGLMPLGLVLYLMRTPTRRRARKAREATEAAAATGVVAPSEAAATPPREPVPQPQEGGKEDGPSEAA